VNFRRKASGNSSFPAGKCQEFVAGIRQPYPAAGFDGFRMEPVKSGHWIRPQFDDFGYRILQENTGNCWNIEAVFRTKMVRIFSGGFLCFPAGTVSKSSEKP
jgi:hypothetical protein